MRLDEEAFFATYKPLANGSASPLELGEDLAGCMFETFGSDREFVDSQGPEHVWTLIDEDGRDYILNGDRAANRVGYLVSTVPWHAGEDIVVELSL